jgi:hypothetical protein
MPVPILSPPMAGIAPPPVGPQRPDPRAVDKVKQAIEQYARATRMLFDAIEMEPRLAKPLNPIIEKAIGLQDGLTKAVRQSIQPPPAPRGEERGPEDEPVDRTPTGDVGPGNPLLSAIQNMRGGMR